MAASFVQSLQAMSFQVGFEVQDQGDGFVVLVAPKKPQLEAVAKAAEMAPLQ